MSTAIEALEISMRMNRRRQRAEALIHEVMRQLRHLDRDVERDVYHALDTVFTEAGVEVLTDFHRQEMGLPPRGPDGWTLAEIAAYDRRFLDALLRPLPPVAIPLTLNAEKARATPKDDAGE